jgi:hypothetical protein
LGNGFHVFQLEDDGSGFGGRDVREWTARGEKSGAMNEAEVTGLRGLVHSESGTEVSGR